MISTDTAAPGHPTETSDAFSSTLRSMGGRTKTFLTTREAGVLGGAIVIALLFVGVGLALRDGSSTETVTAAAPADPVGADEVAPVADDDEEPTDETPPETTEPPTTTEQPETPPTTTEQPAEDGDERSTAGGQSSGGSTPSPTPTTQPPTVTAADTRVDLGSVVGQPLSDATAVLEFQGLTVASSSSCTGAAANSVLTQSPVNTLVDPGTTVTLTAERGDCVQVPNVSGALLQNTHCFSGGGFDLITGEPIEDPGCNRAVHVLAAAGLNNYAEVNLGGGCGTVGSQAPAAGSWVPADTEVTVTSPEPVGIEACIG